MKYTTSKDGVERVTLTIRVRLTRSEWEKAKIIAKVHGYGTVRMMLGQFVEDGLDAAAGQYDDSRLED